MTSMHKVMRVVALTAMVASGFVGRADAAAIVFIDPASQEVPSGADPILALIKVKDLVEPVGGFEIHLAFDPTILEGVSYVNDPDLKMSICGFCELSLGFGAFGPGTLDLFVIGDPLANAAVLAAAQGPFPAVLTLASLAFRAVGDGVSPLTLTLAELSNADGTSLLRTGPPIHGRVCVGGPCPTAVPEPGLLALFSTGVAVFAVRRRSRRSR
jgi:hypothetical protein